MTLERPDRANALSGRSSVIRFIAFWAFMAADLARSYVLRRIDQSYEPDSRFPIWFSNGLKPARVYRYEADAKSCRDSTRDVGPAGRTGANRPDPRRRPSCRAPVVRGARSSGTPAR